MNSSWMETGAMPALKDGVRAAADQHAILAAELAGTGAGFQGAVNRRRAAEASTPQPRPPEAVAAEMAQNSLRHQALMRLLSSRYTALRQVLREGR